MKKHKLLTLLLAFGMMIVFIPAMAFAQGSNAQTETSVASVTSGDTTTYYDTLHDAFKDAVQDDNAVVTVLQDIEEGKGFSNSGAIRFDNGNLTLDLNGHFVEANKQQGFQLFNDVKMTIKDSSANQDGVLTNTEYATVALWNSSQLTLESGTIYNKGYAVFLGAAPTFIMEGGTASSESGTPVQIGRNADGATIVVNDGLIFTPDGQNAIQNWGLNSTIEVHGGVLDALNFSICSRNYTDPDTHESFSSEGAYIYVTGGEFYANNFEIQPGTLVIEGNDESPIITGQLSVGGKNAVCDAHIDGGVFQDLLARNNGSYEITGGVFTGELRALGYENEGQTIESRYTISGGKFADADVATALAEDSVIAETPEGELITVSPLDELAAVVTSENGEEAYYLDLDEAVAALKDGDLLTVVNAPDYTDINTDKDVIVANGTEDSGLYVNGTLIEPEDSINTKTGEVTKGSIGTVREMIEQLTPSDEDFSDQVAAARAAFDALPQEQKDWMKNNDRPEFYQLENKLLLNENLAATDLSNARVDLYTKILVAMNEVGKSSTYKKATYTPYANALKVAKALIGNDTAKAKDFRDAAKALDSAQKALKVKTKNPLNVKGKTVTIKIKKAKKLKKAKTYKVTKVIQTKKKGVGKVTYTKASGNKSITVAKNGKVTVKKGLKKGTYKVKVKVKAAGNDNYKAITKTVTFTIKVKK